MKQPEVGELWLDLPAYAKTRSPRLLLVTAVGDDAVQATAIEGGQPGPNGVPLRYFAESMVWQGYWSTKHQKLPRLEAPFPGHTLSSVQGAHHTEKLHGTADLVNSIIHSWTPRAAEPFNAERQRVVGGDLHKPVSQLPSGRPYLKLVFKIRIDGGPSRRPGRSEELWYQKQGNAWYLVRTLAWPTSAK